MGALEAFEGGEGGVSHLGDAAETLSRAMAEVGEGSMWRGGVVNRSVQEASGAACLLMGREEGGVIPDWSGVAGSELLLSESFSASDTGLRSSVKCRSRCLNPANEPGRSGDELDDVGRDADLVVQLPSPSAKELGASGEFAVFSCELPARVAALTLVERLESCATPLDALSKVTALPRDRVLVVKLPSMLRSLTAGPATGTSYLGALFIDINPAWPLADALLE